MKNRKETNHLVLIKLPGFTYSKESEHTVKKEKHIRVVETSAEKLNYMESK